MEKSVKVYAVELSDYDAQKVVKIFKKKEDAEYLVELANQVYKINEMWWKMHRYRNDRAEEMIDEMHSIIRDIGDILGTDTFFSRAFLLEYEIE